MKSKLLIFPKLNFNHIYFFFFFLISFIKIVIRKWIDNNNKDLAQRLFNIYTYTISDLISVIPLVINKCISGKSKPKNKAKRTASLESNITFIFRDHWAEKHKSLLLKTLIVAIADLLAQLITFIFYMIKGENEREVEEYNLNTILIVRIVSVYLLSLIILKTYFYKHHYFSFIINIICLLFLSILDILNINKKRTKDALMIIIYIFVKIFSTLFYSLENVYGKKALMKEFLSPYSILMYIGIYEFIFLIILSIPLIFIETKDATDNYKKSIIFKRFDKFIDYTYIIKNATLMITNFFYNLTIWTIIDKYSPNHIAMANIFESFGASLYLVIFERNKVDRWTIYVTFIIYIFLIFGAFIHNEFIVINACGLNENTTLFLDYRAEMDLLQAKTKDNNEQDYSLSEELSSHEFGNNNNEKNGQLFEMKNDIK